MVPGGEQVCVGVIVARERIEHPWQDQVWRAVEVLATPLPLAPWTILRTSETATVYYAGTTVVELHRNDASAYRENLAGAHPLLYVVLRQDPEHDGPEPVDVVIVSASAFDAQANAESGSEIVSRVPMPPAMLTWLIGFLDCSDEEEPFVKRQRVAHHRAKEHNFGQEPIEVLRERMRQVDGERDDDA